MSTALRAALLAALLGVVGASWSGEDNVKPRVIQWGNLEFDATHGVYSLHRASDGKLFVYRSAVRVGEWDSRKGVACTCERKNVGEDGEVLRVRMEFAKGPVMVLEYSMLGGTVLLRAGLNNTTTEPIQLKELYPLWARAAEGGGLFVGPDPAKDHRVFTGEGDFVCPTLSRRIDAESANLLTVVWLDDPKLETLVMGGLTTFEFQQRASVQYTKETCLKKDGRRSIDGWLRVFDYTGRRIDPGEEYLADAAYFDFSQPDPCLALENYAHRVAAAMDVHLANYNDYIPECLWYVWAYSGGGRMANTSTGAVEEASRMIASGIAKYAPPLVRLVPDEYTNPNEQLWWDEPHWQKFVHLTPPYKTLQKWTAAMQALDCFGDFYMQPTYRSDDYCEQFPDHMLGNDPKRGPDYTDLDFMAHMREVYGRMKAADVRGTFYDYSAQYMNVAGGFEDPKATAISAYRRLFGVAKEVMGPQFLITENPFTYGNGAEVATGLIDAKRSEDDKVTFTQTVVKRGVREWYRNRVTKLIDPDVKNFATRDGDLLHAQVSGMAFLFGKLMLGSSVTRYPKEVIPIIGRGLPLPVDIATARPVGLFAGCDEDSSPNPEVYDYRVGNGDHILLLWNHSGEGDKTISADLGKRPAFGGVGLEAGNEYDVWDFWDWRPVGRVKGNETLALSVRPAEMKVLAMRKVQSHPYLLSTNRHVLQGQVDAHGLEWDEKTKTLSGMFDVVGGDTYKAIIQLPDARWRVAEWTLDASADVSRRMRQDPGQAWAELAIDAPESARLAWRLKCTLEDRPVEAVASVEPTTRPAPAMATTAKLSAIDSCDGSWQGRQGAEGYYFFSYNGEGEDVSKLPAYAGAVHWGENAGGWVFSRRTDDARALRAPEGQGRRLGAVFSRGTLDIYVDLSDRAPHAVSLYCVDFDRRGRRMSLTVLDPGTLRPIAPVATLEHFGEGICAELVLSGSAVIRLANLAPGDGARNAVVSALFFDSPKPRAPQPFRLHPPQLGKDKTYRFSWEPSPSAEYYRLLVMDEKGNAVVDEGVTTTSLDVPGLKQGKQYDWLVEARNERGVVCAPEGKASLVAKFPPPSVAEWLTTDRDTRDAWKGVYGKAGRVLFASREGQAADVVELPPFIVSATATGERETWQVGDRSGSFTYAFNEVALEVTARDTKAHRMALAFSSPYGRNTLVEIWDPHYNTRLCRAWIAKPIGETRYLVFNVKGDVRVRLLRDRDCFPKNVLLSGVLWD